MVHESDKVVTTPQYKDLDTSWQKKKVNIFYLDSLSVWNLEALLHARPLINTHIHVDHFPVLRSSQSEKPDVWTAHYNKLH